MPAGDTIAALSSGALPSGVAVIRLSGPASGPALRRMVGELPEARRLALLPLRVEGELVDRGLVAWFPAPASFTGEDCAELQLHGSPAVVRKVLRGLVAEGVRLAEAGEFTRRAFENGKLDLTEVEGLGDLLGAETEAQRRQALRRLSGELSDRLASWREALLDARAEIEAQLDFSDEADVGQLPAGFAERLQRLAAEFDEAIETVGRGRIVRSGLRVAIAGPPNAGKSSLLNALARSDIAIVTDEAGTTRDVREVPIDLDGQLVILLDMAGLRATDSKAEAEGVRRARHEIAGADLVLWLDAPDLPPGPPPETAAPLWRIGTKADIGTPPGCDLALSTVTGAGLGELVARLRDYSASAVAGGPALISRERDLVALAAARRHVAEALDMVEAPELAAEALRAATQALERLLGRVDAEAVLGRLFSAFCIGK